MTTRSETTRPTNPKTIARLGMAVTLATTFALASCGALTSSQSKENSIPLVDEISQGTIIKLTRNAIFREGQNEIIYLSGSQPGMQGGCHYPTLIWRVDASASGALPAMTPLTVQSTAYAEKRGFRVFYVYTKTPKGSPITITFRPSAASMAIDTFGDCMEFSNVVKPGASTGELPNIPIIE